MDWAYFGYIIKGNEGLIWNCIFSAEGFQIVQHCISG